MVFDRLASRIVVGLQDDRSGLDGETVIDGANYRLTKPHSFAKAFIVTGLTTTGPGSATGVETVTLTVNGGTRKLPHGVYTFLIRSGGIQDIAGNALDGEFYGFFPSGNNRPGGDFVAAVEHAFHNIVLAPVPIERLRHPRHPARPPGRRVHRFAHRPPRGTSRGRSTPSTHDAKVASRMAHHDAALAAIHVPKKVGVR